MTTHSTTSKTTTVVSEIVTTNVKHASVQETLQKVDASLVPAIESFVQNIKSGTMPGLDFLHVKNDLLLSYLIDLVLWVRDCRTEMTDSGNTHTLNMQQRRLVEMRTILDKVRSLDKKLRYQIDKLLSVASSPSSAFVTAGEKDDDENVERDNNNDDPLHFRPDLASFQVTGDDDDDDEEEEEEEGHEDEEEDSDGSDDQNSDDDAELAAARAIVAESKHKSSSNDVTGVAGEKKNKTSRTLEGDAVYRAPHLTAVPYTYDVQNKQREVSKRERKRLYTTEMAQMLRSQYGDAPEMEDIHGGGTSDYGKQRLASRKLHEHEAERNKYEESAMIRLTTSRKEKKDRKRVKQMEGSNLAMMAGLGNLVRESKVLLQSSGNNSDDGDDYNMTTKERRRGGGDDRPKKRMRDAGRGGGGRGERARNDDQGRHHKGKRSRMRI